MFNNSVQFNGYILDLKDIYSLLGPVDTFRCSLVDVLRGVIVFPSVPPAIFRHSYQTPFQRM